MNAILIKDLTKTFRDKIAVDHISLEIEQGIVFALLGLNGAGKTTTIKMLSGLLTPTYGDAWLLGDSIIENPLAVKEKINISPQETAIAPNLSVYENLVFIARIYGVSQKQALIKADQMISDFGLEEYSGKKTKYLSGGFKRRLSIAMALITEPEILFLDEPTLGLDVRARRELWKVLINLKGKVTIVLTTHYLDEAEALADIIGIMDQGIIKGIGTIGELRENTKLEKIEDIFLSYIDKEVL